MPVTNGGSAQCIHAKNIKRNASSRSRSPASHLSLSKEANQPVQIPVATQLAPAPISFIEKIFT
jgi:hypothetical protein